MTKWIAVTLGTLFSFIFPLINVAVAGESINAILQTSFLPRQAGGQHPGEPVSASGGENTDLSSMQAKTGPAVLSNREILGVLRPDKLTRPPAETPAAPRLPLALLEEDLRVSPDVLIALAELEESQSLLEQQQAFSGLKLFGGAGVGAYRKPVTDTLTRDYQRGHIQLGVRYPLLGSREKERFGVLTAEARTREKEQEIPRITHENLGILHSAYVSYWSSQRKIALSAAFLENEPRVRKILNQRTRANYLLDADRRTYMSSFAFVRKNMAHTRTIHSHAFNIIRLLTKPTLTAFTPDTPRLPEPCQDINQLMTAVMATHPEIALLRKQVETQLALQQATLHYSDIKANVSLAGTASSDLPERQAGYGVALNLNVQLPAHIQKLKTARRKTARAALKKARRKLALRRATLSEEAEEALGHYLSTLENVRFAAQHLKAEMEKVRENTLRSAYLAGDTIEKLQQSRFSYYKSAMRYIDAETDKLQAQAKLLQFSPNGCRP